MSVPCLSPFVYQMDKVELTIHQRIAGFLFNLLSLYARFLHLGEVIAAPFEMRHLPRRASREPDLLFLAREHQDLLTPQRLDGPADLVVELISDSSVVRDREHKFDEYQAAGVREYWIIDPRPGSERVDFYQLSVDGRYQPVVPDDRERYHAAVLPGFWLDTTWLLQDPLPDPLTCLAAIAPHILRAALTAAGPDAGADEEVV